MYQRLIILLLYCAAGLMQAQGASRWTEEMYGQYTCDNYTDYAAFNNPVAAESADAALLEAAVFYETNRQRALHEKTAFAYDQPLNACAHDHSANMVEYDFFSHESPVAGKQTLPDRLAEVGYPNYTCAENIAIVAAQGTYAEVARHLVADKWMHSKPHRANILRSGLTHLGCGVAFYQDGKFLYVKATQNFLKKL